jgi:hypothetical protein
MGAGVKALMIYYFHEGWNWSGDENQDSELHFDAPLDKEMNPRPAFTLLMNLGEALNNGLGEIVADSHTARSTILIAHDSGAQYPISGDSRAIDKASTDSASLYGMLREAGFNADLGFIDRMSQEEINHYQVIFWDHPGYLTKDTETRLRYFLGSQRTLITFGNSGIKAGPNQKLIVWEKNPALGWNEDSYLKLPETQVALSKLQQFLLQQGYAVPLWF